MKNKLKYEKISKDDFGHIYSDMLKQFPIEELKSKDKFLSLLDNKMYHINKIFDNENMLGYILFNEFDGSIWIDYIAILKCYHCKGYGSKIFNDIANTFDEINGCYLEVEKPDEKNPDTIRRIKFYTKLGAKKININYIFPNNFGNLPMDLYYIPFKNNPMPEKKDVLAHIYQTFETLHDDVLHKHEIYNSICTTI